MKACTVDPTSTPIIIWPGTEMMAICPSFFQMKQYPTTEQGCPTLEGGKFRPHDGKLIQSLFAYVVFHLIVMYNRDMYETYHEWTTQDDMQYAVELSSRQSLLHATNYGYYAGGRLLALRPLFGILKC